jgi:hypothetical protein
MGRKGETVIEWCRVNGGVVFAGIFVVMFLFACALGLVAAGKEVWCFILAGCGG